MIYTVTGSEKKEELGVTLAHEHLLWVEGDTEELYFKKIYNQKKLEEYYEQLLPVLNKLYECGCRTIVEASPPVGGQNIKLMSMLSKESGIKIIANTGMAFENSVYEIRKDFKEEELASRWIKDFNEGLDIIGGVKIVPNQIKLLLGDDDEKTLSRIDEKILRGAINASKETGMKIHCHIFQCSKLLHAIEIMEEEEFDFNSFLWAHACREGNQEVIGEAFNRGIWIGFDSISEGKYHYYFELVGEAIRRGYGEKIILSQDLEFYEEVKELGDHNPCCDIFNKFLDYCHKRGLSKDIILDIMSKNPGEYLDIKERLK